LASQKYHLTNEELMALVMTFLKIRAGVADSERGRTIAGDLQELFHFGINHTEFELDNDGLWVTFDYSPIIRTVGD